MDLKGFRGRGSFSGSCGQKRLGLHSNSQISPIFTLN